MKSFIILFMLAGALAFPTLTNAQAAPADNDKNSDLNVSLDMARNMIKVLGGLTNSFADFKGDFLQKDGSENSYYSVKNLEMNTDTHFVVMRHTGDYTYAAVYKPKDSGDKIPALAFAAFTGGISTIGGSNFVIVEDSAAQPKGTLKYFLTIKGNKVASFTFDVANKTGTFIAAIQ
ncbi:MAG: hypothetical protein ABJA76_19415 [Mucilaginibacter sp.]